MMLAALPAMTRALNSLLMVVKFSLEATSLPMDREDDRSHASLLRPPVEEGGGGGGAGGVRAWMSLKCCSSSSAIDPLLVVGL